MQIRLIVIGSKQKDWVEQAFLSYSKRLPKHWQFCLHEIPSPKRAKNESIPSLIKKEGLKVLSAIKDNEYLIVLDEKGTQFSSSELSEKIINLNIHDNRFCFVIGGADGLSDEVKKRANLIWSLSKSTLPHSLVRVIFIEQIYRVWTLMSQHPYHRA